MYHILNRTTLYPDIIDEFSKAKERIIIDAYIWINDEIGNKLAQAVFSVAERGVKVYIRKDLSGSVFEHTPGRIPFFLKKSDLEEGGPLMMSAKFFNNVAYHIYGKKSRPEIKPNIVLDSMGKHKNIFIDNFPLFNHGKLLVVDDISYVGGQCISNDYTIWKDYNIKIKNQKVTENIIRKINGEKEVHENQDVIFLHNIFSKDKSIYHYMKDFIDDLKEKEKLLIEMSYFGMWFFPIIKKAIKRGVEVTILTSKEADTNHHTNMLFLSKLLKLKKDNVAVFLSDDMIHTKGMVNTKKVIIGAANFHSANSFFKGLNEQNIYSENKELVNNIIDCFKKDIGESTKINNHLELPKFSKRKAIVERFFVLVSIYFVSFNKRKIQKYRDVANERLVKEYV